MDATSSAVSLPLSSSKEVTMGAFAVPPRAPQKTFIAPEVQKPELTEEEIAITIATAKAVLEAAKKSLVNNTPLPNSVALLLDKNKNTLIAFKNRLADEVVLAIGENNKEKPTSLRNHIETIDKAIEEIKSTKEKLLTMAPGVKSVMDGISKKETLESSSSGEKIAAKVLYMRPPTILASLVTQETIQEQKRIPAIPEHRNQSPAPKGTTIFETRLASPSPQEIVPPLIPKENKIENSLASVAEAVSAIEKIYPGTEERMIPPGIDPLVATAKSKPAGRKEEFIFNQLSTDEKRQLLIFATKTNEECAEEMFAISKEVYTAIANRTSDGEITPYKILHDENLPGLYVMMHGEQTDVRKEASILIQGIIKLAQKLSIANAEPKEIGKETLEQFMEEKRELISHELNKANVTSTIT